MPTVGVFHEKFWKRQDADHTPPALAAGLGGYPSWQAAVVVGSLFGPIAAWWEFVKARMKWWWAFARRVHRLSNEQRLILGGVLDKLETPAFGAAWFSVRETSQILGFREPAMWKGLSTLMKSDVNHAENVFRHLEATRRMRARLDTPVTNPDANLTVELAYLGYSMLRH